MQNFTIFSLYSQWQPHTLYEGVIRKYISNLGWNVTQAYCDGFMSICDVQWDRVKFSRDEICRSCQKSLLASSSYFKVAPVAISNFSQDSIIEREIHSAKSKIDLIRINIDGISVLDNVRSSVISHIRAEFLDLKNPEHFRLAKSYMLSAVKMLTASLNLLGSTDSTSVLLLGGRFAATSLLYSVLKRRKFKVLTYERTLFEDRLFLYYDRQTFMLENSSFDDEYRLPSYSRSDEIELRLWLSKRIARASSHQVFFDKPTEEFTSPFKAKYDSYISKLKYSENLEERDLICIFTSSMDEWSEIDTYNPIMSQAEWLRQVLDYFLGECKQRYQLFVKLHPNAISNGQYEDAHIDILKVLERYKCSQSLLVCESAETSINPYQLLSIARASVTFGSTISIESLMFGVPSLVMSRTTFYSPQGFVRPLNEKSLPAALDKLIHFPWNKDFLYTVAMGLLSNFRRNTYECRPVKLTGRHIAGLKQGEIERYGDSLFSRLSTLLAEGTDVRERTKAVSNSIKQITHTGKPFTSSFFTVTDYISLSVVITNYNYSRYIRQCINSILTCIDLFKELIIVDDASTDSSVEVINEILGQLNPDIRSKVSFVALNDNQGQPSTVRNIGASMANGSHLMFLDADDWLQSSELQNLLEFVVCHPRSVVYFDRIDVHSTGQAFYVKSRSFDKVQLFRGNYLNYCSVMPKFMFELVGGYRENVPGTEDWDLWVAFSVLNAEFIWFDRAILFYRVKMDGLNARTLPALKQRHQQILRNNKVLDWA
jgi:hypothetical protein